MAAESTFFPSGEWHRVLHVMQLWFQSLFRLPTRYVVMQNRPTSRRTVHEPKRRAVLPSRRKKKFLKWRREQQSTKSKQECTCEKNKRTARYNLSTPRVLSCECPSAELKITSCNVHMMVAGGRRSWPHARPHVYWHAHTRGTVSGRDEEHRSPPADDETSPLSTPLPGSVPVPC